MKKMIFWLLIIAVATALVLPNQIVKAKPVEDYATISPTVKIESYKLARNGDIYQALSASATIISPQGHLLTNSHVVLDERDDPYDVFGVCLSYQENQEPVCEYSASLLAYDKNLDAALLIINPLDNRGWPLPILPYFDYQFSGEVAVGETLDVYGYPDIGGKTLTQTRGQVSGFEDKNGINYLKTDTDISGGNSGGTALDGQGNFVGVPTYLMSSYENIGYVLDIKEAQEFVDTHLFDEPQFKAQAAELLKVKMNLFNDSKDTNVYVHPYYPRFNLTASEGWEWDSISRTSLALLKRSNEGDKNIEINIFLEPFKIDDAYVSEYLRIQNLFTDYLTNYQEQAATFAGQSATLSTFNVYSKKYYTYSIPYGNSLVIISYQVDLDKAEADLAEFNEVLNTFAFIDLPQNNPYLITTYLNNNPSFAIGTAGNWYLQRNQQAYRENLIVTYANAQALWGRIAVSYYELAEGNKELTNSQALDKEVQSYQYSEETKIINKNDSVMVDNLSGWSITYLSPGLEQDKLMKTSILYLRDGDYLYEISYEDLIDSYNANLPFFKEIVKTFKNYNQAAELIGSGEFSLGTMDYIFTDIIYHRFEQAITNLAEKGIVTGHSPTTFRPEKKILSSEAKLYITNSILESKRANTDEQGDEFLAGEEVTLANALKALIQVYQLNIWVNDNDDAPEWKPYLDKGFELGLLPAGLVDPDQALTRAEFTYILNQLLDSFKVF